MEMNTPQMNTPMAGVPTPATSSMPPGAAPAVPVGAKIIAALFYIASIAFIFFGIIAAFLSSLNLSVLGSFGVSYGLLPGILSIAWGILSFFAGRGLWTGQQWGRILAVTISALYIIFAVATIFILGSANYISLVINLVIILYLLLSKDVRAGFASAQPISVAIILAVLAVIVYAVMEYPNLTPKQTAMDQALGQMQQISNQLKKYQTTPQNSGTNLNTTGAGVQNQPTTTPTQASVPDNSNVIPVSNGLYTNSNYGFQMSVPDGTSYFEDNQSPPTDNFMFINGQQVSIFGITITPATDSLEVMASKTAGFDPSQTTHTIIGGEQAIQCNTNAGGTSVFNFYLIHNGNFYELSQGRALSTSDFAFWLNTFKFTK